LKNYYASAGSRYKLHSDNQVIGFAKGESETSSELEG
jgi:hypothetical protein